MVELPSLVPAEFVVPARLEAEHGLLLRMLSAADVEVRPTQWINSRYSL
jgi:hypothetical protein